jgi:hypothetical protein
MTNEVDEQSGLKALVCNPPYLLSDVFREFPDKLLIRDCVEDTIKGIRSQGHKIPILITGTPGIGKSVSIFVILHKIVTGEITNVDNIILDIQIANNLYIVYKNASGIWDEVVLTSRTRNDISDFVGSKVSSRIKLSTAEIFKTTWYIYDGCISTQPLAVNPCIKRIVFSSPNIGHFKVYAKNPSLYAHYVPVWELHEIRAAFDLYFGKAFSLKWDDVFDLFCKWGGLPRYVFLDTAKSIQLLKSALTGCNIKSLMETVMQNSSFLGFNETTASNVRTKLIHFEVSQGSVKPTFASSYIRDELLNLSETEFHGFYSEFSKSHGSKSFAAAVRGTLYEKCVLDYLSCLELNLPFCSIQSKQSRKVICLPKLTAMHYCTLEDIDTSLINILWIPITSNFKSFDCLIQLEFLSL